jgi:phosphate:Na+ symporter
MLTGFAAQGMVALAPGLAVMLGAGVGTTLIVQLLAFDVAAFAPVLILAGVLLFRRAAAAAKDFGRVLIGLGLLLMALHQFLALLRPLAETAWLRAATGQLQDHIVLAVLAAAVITWAAHSSVAVVLLVMSFAAQGLVPPEAAFALVLGANLGTAVNPVLEGGHGSDAQARRLPLGNLIMRLAGVALALAAWPWLAPWFASFGGPDPARAVANFHMAFNLALAALFFPWLSAYAGVLKKMIPDKAGPVDPGAPMYLEPSVAGTPGVALGAASREALRMADILEEMLRSLRAVLEKPDAYKIGETRRLDDVLDRLNGAIKSYVTTLEADAMSEADHRRALQVLTFATNLEHAGDLIDRSLLALVAKKMKRGVHFSAEGQAELVALVDRLIVNARTAASIFASGDTRAAALLIEEKQAFADAQADATRRHFERLRAGREESAATSSIHLDALRDLKRVNAHLAAGAAKPVLEVWEPAPGTVEAAE